MVSLHAGQSCADVCRAEKAWLLGYSREPESEHMHH